VNAWQPWALAEIPPVGRYLVFDARIGADLKPSLARLRETFSTESGVLGLGEPLVKGLGATVPGLRAFPAIAGPACAFPSTQGAVWAFLAGQGEGELHDRGFAIATALGDAFSLREEVTGFKYRDGRDLTGYIDGTANPPDLRAIEAAIVTGVGPGLDGSTFVAVQRYVHDLVSFRKLSPGARDDVFGRRLSDNEEMAEAPRSAHAKRTEQEYFKPSGFMVRRSMPWGGLGESGIYFVAYGESLDRYEHTLRRMAGLEDGVVDALLSFTHPMTGGYYWCPPAAKGKLDLSVLGL
jgi:putative iron-dependent peroxidase